MISAKDLKHNLTEEKQNQEKTNGHTRTVSRGPSPNRGASVPDHEAIGPDREDKEAWRQKRSISRSSQIKLVKLTHMRYQHPDLNVITTFLRDFGMRVVAKTPTQRWYSGYGPDQYVYYAQEGPAKYLGGTFEVESPSEFDKISQLPNITVLNNGVQSMTDAPGGGQILSILDPEGFPVNFTHGQAAVTDTRSKPAKLIHNDETDKPRQRAFQRFEAGPAEVHKLGHFGLNVQDFPAQMDWYTRHFNICPSDILYINLDGQTDEQGNPKRKEVALFAHIDRGEDLVDHHTMFLTTLTPGIEKHVHHCSFEVHDMDTQALGHQWLAGKGYDSVWGVGRHILGSQIFDYWWDPNRFMVEHYADGDLVNEKTPLGYGPAGHEGLAVWGPDVPKEFLE